jgi:hypothetical protein
LPVSILNSDAHQTPVFENIFSNTFTAGLDNFLCNDRFPLLLQSSGKKAGYICFADSRINTGNSDNGSAHEIFFFRQQYTG